MDVGERDRRRHPFIDRGNRRDGMRYGNRHDDIRRHRTDNAVSHGSAKRSARQVVLGRMRELRAAESRAEKARAALGLDPSSHARLVKERAEASLAGFDLDAAIRAGREVLDAQGRER